MVKRTLTLEDSIAEFIDNYAALGFRSAAELVSQAVALLREQVQRQTELEESAKLYSEIYAEDQEGQDWVEDSIQDWPDYD